MDLKQYFTHIDNFALSCALESKIDLHAHSFFELGYIKEGTLKHTLNGESSILTQGQYFFMDYLSKHSYESLTNNVLVVNVLFRPTLIDNSLFFCRDIPTLLRHYMIKINVDKLKTNPTTAIYNDEDGKIWELISKMLHEYENPNFGYTEIIRSLLIELLVYTMRKISYNENASNENLVDYAIEKILSDCSKPPTLAELGEKFNYSIPYVSLKFKQATGENYRDYVTKIRLNEAKRLLLNTTKKINEIAKLIGYIDINSFYIAFKKDSGYSPNRFRTNFKK